MSGTSADGIDVALCRIGPGQGYLRGMHLLRHRGFPYAPALRRAVLEAMNAACTSAAELARLHWRLGQAYGEAVRATVAEEGSAIDLVGCHGQTIYHQAVAARYAGARLACTWQLGEPAVTAAIVGVPVVSNFRAADMAAGGQGAPLVPLLDYVLFRHARRGRVLQNLGGIANFTAIPPGAQADTVLAFDSGPANMAIDGLMQHLFAKPYDRDGRVAARGQVSEALLGALLRDPFYRKPPPKSAGREQYGAEFVERLMLQSRRLRLRPEDVIATATALTARTVADAYRRFAHARMGGAPVDYIVSGGGARNATLVEMLRRALAPMGCELSDSEAYGLPPEAKEAAAFALLAYETWHLRPGNLPSATGARKAVILGQITYG
jgi:anhydro-N-acetylmuramic acid kinase